MNIPASLIRVAAAGLALAAAAGAAPDTAPDPAIAALVERLLDTDEQTHRPEDLAPHPAERAFRFDAVLAYPPADLLEAVRVTLEKNPPPEDPGDRAPYERAMQVKLQALLEYYPLVAKTPEDFQALLDTIYSGARPALLRVFLLRRTAPGLAAPSALGEYIHTMLAGSGNTFDKKLSDLIRNITEPPAVQEAATRALGARTAAAYAALLPAVPPDVTATVPLTGAAQARLDRLNQFSGGTVTMLLTVIRDKNRAPHVRDTARATAAAIAENYPIPDRETLLDQIAAEP